MKKLMLFSLALAILPMLGCEAGTNDKSKQTKNNTETVAEKTAPAPAEKTVEGKVIHLTKQEFLDKVMNYEKNPNEWIYEGDKPSVIDFYADWCQPCKIAGPILEELAQEYAGEIVVYKIDTQQERELAAAFGIRSIPAFLWIPTDGKPQMSNGIARTPEDTKKMFKDIIDDFLL